MNVRRFDTLAKTVATVSSRRLLLRAGLATLGAWATAPVRIGRVAAFPSPCCAHWRCPDGECCMQNWVKFPGDRTLRSECSCCPCDNICQDSGFDPPLEQCCPREATCSAFGNGCVCPPGTSLCGNTCSERCQLCHGVFVDTMRDVAHCGGCDSVCADGQVCQDGRCGNCAIVCLGGKECRGHQCVCPDGLKDCNGKTGAACCVDGDCDGKVCHDGQCVCDAGLRDCNGICKGCCSDGDCAGCASCMDGTCRSGCPLGHTCERGRCRACADAETPGTDSSGTGICLCGASPCTAGLVCCGPNCRMTISSCVSPASFTSVYRCGGCGGCPAASRYCVQFGTSSNPNFRCCTGATPSNPGTCTDVRC